MTASTIATAAYRLRLSQLQLKAHMEFLGHVQLHISLGMIVLGQLQLPEIASFEQFE